MRRVLGSAVPVLLALALPLGALSACGDDDSGSVADDPAPTSSSPSSSPSSTAPASPDGSTGDPAAVDFELVQVITETAAGGAPTPTAVPLTDEAAVQEFTAQFTSATLPGKVADAVAATDVPDGMTLYGAVVAIGCDAPTDVAVTDEGAGVVVTALKVPSPQQECFAPMTTVALVLVAS